MVFPKFMSHNQGFFTSAFVSLILLLAMLSCHLTPAEKKEVIAQVSEVATAVATSTPIPWDTVGLIVGSLISTGLVIDNRRKDVLIKAKDKANAQNSEMLLDLTRANGNVSSSVRTPSLN